MKKNVLDLLNITYEDIYNMQHKHILDLRKAVENPNEETLALWHFEDQRQDSILEYYRMLDRRREEANKKAEKKEEEAPLNVKINAEVKKK